MTGVSRLGYGHTLGSLFSKIFRFLVYIFQKKIFFEIFSWVSVLCCCFDVIVGCLRVVVECSCIEILILRLFLGDFRWGKRVFGIVTHFSLLSAKFKGF